MNKNFLTQTGHCPDLSLQYKGMYHMLLITMFYPLPVRGKEDGEKTGMEYREESQQRMAAHKIPSM